MITFPPEAYAPTGELWWQLSTYPGTRRRFGGEVKMAAYLTFNCAVGDVFTLRQLREAIPGEDGEANDQEHFNRRLRALRKFRWRILSAKDDGSLGPAEYRLTTIGDPIWLGKAQYQTSSVSAGLRRQVLDRDGNRCVLCGIGSGEPYPDDPKSRARMTVGHFQADQLQGAANLDNLRTECSRCNEPVRNEHSQRETVDDIWPRIVRLPRADKSRLVEWLQTGTRTRTDVDRAYDSIRVLPAGQRDELLQRLRTALLR